MKKSCHFLSLVPAECIKDLTRGEEGEGGGEGSSWGGPPLFEAAVASVPPGGVEKQSVGTCASWSRWRSVLVGLPPGVGQL